MQLIAVDSLEVGMLLAQDVVSDNFVHIVSESTAVTIEIILKLQQLDIDFVYVHSNKLSQESETVKPVKKDINPLDGEAAIKYYYSQTIECVKTIVNDLKFGESKINGALPEVIAPLLQGVLSHNNILSSLRCFEKNDDYLLKHSIEVGVLSAMIGKWMNMSNKNILDLGVAGMLHDIGKVKVPKYIMSKTNKLSPQEYNIAKKHSDFGLEILNSDGGFNQEIKDGVLYHHERFNGSGYPKGLKGKSIPLFARIVAVADVFDAIISDRVFQIKSSPIVAAEILKGMSFDELDPEITNLFLKKISEHYVGSKVLLSTGEKGEIVYLNKYSINKPLVRVGEKFIDLTMQAGISIKDML